MAAPSISLTRSTAPIALYCRVSTAEQTLDVQLEALRFYAQRRGCEALEFSDHGVSGARDRRPGLDAMLKAVRRREVCAVLVCKLDRLARSTRHLCELAEELQAVGCALVVLDQAIDTETLSGRLLFQVLGAVAEFERGLIVERVRAGLAAAKRRGKRLGRQRFAPGVDGRGRDAALLERVRALRAEGRSFGKIAAVLGVSRSMAYKLAREAAAA